MKNSTVHRLACVDLPAFPLQLLLRRHPDWAAYPAAVVAEDKPQGLVLWVNEKARRHGVLPGLRYAAAFSLATALRAGEVAQKEIDHALGALTQTLMRFTPEVEPAKEEPGVFWLNGAGLGQLYASPQKWAHAIGQELREQNYRVSLAVGFTRFGSYAVAKAREGITVFSAPDDERSAAHEVPLNRLAIEPKFRDALSKLGIYTVGALLALPPGGLRERFGKEAHRLHRMAAGDLWTPLDPCPPEEPLAEKYLFDDPENDTTRLLFLIKQLLHALLTKLAARSQALTTLWLCMLIDRNGWQQEPLRPAAPTLAEVQILDLIRLRLESLTLPAGISEIELRAESCAATVEQLRLFVERPRRDLDAANRALARLRAEFGDDAVVCAKLADGHLPEARFAWEPLKTLKTLNLLNPSNKLRAGSAPQLNAESHKANDLNNLNEPLTRSGGLNALNSSSPKLLIRRVNAKPICLAGGPYHSHEDGWLILGPKYGNIDKLTGPYVFSGGWWNREIQREYYYAETRRGDVLWLYYDRVRRRWFLQGAVE